MPTPRQLVTVPLAAPIGGYRLHLDGGPMIIVHLRTRAGLLSATTLAMSLLAGFSRMR